MTWKIVPLSEAQLLDVRPEDALFGALARRCETYRGGGGYDQFPRIAERRFGTAHHQQFVVQLFGCHLDCPYCYVTRAGVWGEFERVSSKALVDMFAEAHLTHGVTVFHLMGGAPALQIKHWPELIDALQRLDFDWVFHSDMLLTEAPYAPEVLRQISGARCLYAVDVKGLTADEHLHNTRKQFHEDLFWNNLALVEAAEVPYYLTFTAVAEPELFWKEFGRRWPQRLSAAWGDAFSIDLIQYNALPHVDSVPWGAQRG